MIPKLHTLLALSLLSVAAACGGDSDSPASGSSAAGGSTATGGSTSAGTGGSTSAGAGGSTTAGAGGSTSAGAGGSTSAGAGGSTSAGAGGSTSAGAGGSTSAGAGGSTSAGAGGSTSAGAGGASGACNPLVNEGAPIPEVAETGTPPTMTGGAIADGTYVLTERKSWKGSCDCDTRQTMKIAGDVVQVVSRTDADPEVRVAGKITYAGSNLTLAMSCPAPKTLELTYTATATTLMIFDPQKHSLATLTKQ